MPRKHTRADRGSASPRTARSHQELEFRALLDAAVDAIIVVDHHGTIEEFSRAAQQLFGYTPDEIIGRNVRELMPDPYRHEHDGYMHRYMTTGEPRIIGTGREVRAQRKDGSIFPCDLSVGHVRGIDPPRFIGFISDITARKEADERLRRSETELQLAQKLANLGNYVMHPGGETADYFSPQLHRILSRDESECRIVRNEYLEKWVHPADRQRVAEAFARMDAGQAPLDIEYQVVL